MPQDLARGPASDPFARAAAPALAFVDELGRRRDPPAALAAEARAHLDRFGRALADGVPAAAVPPARYALALVIDRQARANPSLDLRLWEAAARAQLFDGRALGEPDLRRFLRSAAEAGPAFAPVQPFLQACLDRLEARRTRLQPPAVESWRGIAAVLAASFGFAVAGWALHVEWSFHHRLAEAFEARAAEAAALPLRARLDTLAEAASGVATEVQQAPVALAAGPLGFDAAAGAEAAYRAEVQGALPAVLVQAVEEAIASEAGPAASYDTVRAWAILSGAADWSPAWLAGWLDRPAAPAEMRGLARHVRQLSPPEGPLPQPDADLLAQARAFAAEASEADRAWLELLRSEGAAALPPWQAEAAVPGLASVVIRRSGAALDAPVPGLFTAAGWTYARDRGAGLAVQAARREARLLDRPTAESNASADRVLELLQAETLARWQALLADLRVVPFQTADTAVRVSGALARPESPLTQLLREVWHQVGGEDPLRPHALQLKIAAVFGPARQFVDQGGMTRIAALFAALNAALGGLDRDSPTGLQRLMQAEDRARSIATLRQAPALVVEIIEDLLAQAGSAQAAGITNPLTAAWQAEVLPLCRATLDGRYPFAEGADADPAAVERLLGRNGALAAFVAARAAPYLDRSASPWRWKPEARFAGLSPDSAAFLERASAAGPGLTGPMALTLTALAERGTAAVTLGGQGGPVTTTSDSLRLDWPGLQPNRGAEIALRTPEGAARLAAPGPWGLLRLLEPFRLRPREGGLRFLIDLRSGGARLFLEAAFDAAPNPLSVRRLVRGLACPQVL